jgi:putative hydrolase of the HAD superfamily
LNIQHIFFDLDHTLWDFRTNSRETLLEMYDALCLPQIGIGDFRLFLSRYETHNESMWEEYRKGLVQKSELRSGRFARTFEEYGIDNPYLAEAAAAFYLEHSPRKTHLMDFALQTLDKLKSRFEMHIITNGFDEVQFQKLRNTGLEPYFGEVITSEQASARKPDPLIFSLAFRRTGAKPSESAMVGDSFEHDILGAMAMGMYGVYYNPYGHRHNRKPDREVNCLSDLPAVFGM